MKKTAIILMIAILFSLCAASCAKGEDLVTESFLVAWVRDDGFVAEREVGEEQEFVFIVYPGAKDALCNYDLVKVTYPKDALVAVSGTEVLEYRTYQWEKTIKTIKELENQGQPPLTAAKPVIYLYPTVPTKCSVKVTLDGKLTCTYPVHGADGWQNVTARPDGTLTFPDGKSYYCLYWEGELDIKPDFSTGFCVKGEDTAAFLEEVLAQQGLNEREANEFIIYWLPKLQENPYNLFSFETELYTLLAELSITPAPDSLLRVYMTAMPSDTYVELVPQSFEPFERNGFTVVEWGGTVFEK